MMHSASAFRYKLIAPLAPPPQIGFALVETACKTAVQQPHQQQHPTCLHVEVAPEAIHLRLVCSTRVIVAKVFRSCISCSLVLPIQIVYADSLIQHQLEQNQCVLHPDCDFPLRSVDVAKQILSPE